MTDRNVFDIHSGKPVFLYQEFTDEELKQYTSCMVETMLKIMRNDQIGRSKDQDTKPVDR